MPEAVVITPSIPVTRASDLIARARQVYDRPGSPLPALAAAEALDGFAGGARWMAAALGELRGRSLPPSDACFHTLGATKYALALVAAIAAAATVFAALPIGWVLAAPAAWAAFYAVEVQLVFLFPVAIDGGGGRTATPFRDARRMLVRAGGTLRAMPIVMRLAAHMLFAGWFRGGPMRAWCTGCLAVCIWHEDVRRESLETPSAPTSRPRRSWRFEVFNAGPLLTRTESVRIAHPEQSVAGKTAAGKAVTGETTLLYASDLHLGHRWTRRIAEDVAAAVRETRPDAVILGGDLVDTKRGLPALASLVEAIQSVTPVFGLLGNHDQRVGADRVRRAVLDAGGHWLEDATLPAVVGGVLLFGPATRADAGLGTAAPRVLCGHDPARFPSDAAERFDLLLAGHLHGGQCVIFQRKDRLYPGAWVNRWTGLRFDANCETGRRRGTVLVSRGATDTLPLRWNCPREVLVCRIVDKGRPRGPAGSITAGSHRL